MTRYLCNYLRNGGACWGYVLPPPGDPTGERKLAAGLYSTPGEAFPGEVASRDWIMIQHWVLPDGFKGTTKDAIDLCDPGGSTRRPT